MSDRTRLVIPHDAKPAGDVELMSLLLAVRQWANTPSRASNRYLYFSALRYWRVSPASVAEGGQ